MQSSENWQYGEHQLSITYRLDVVKAVSRAENHGGIDLEKGR